jgi:hypothetical protein
MKFSLGLFCGFAFGLVLGFAFGAMTIARYSENWRNVSLACVEKLVECEDGTSGVF